MIYLGREQRNRQKQLKQIESSTEEASENIKVKN